VAVVVAHPDDETIGAGSILPCLRNATFIHTTDGAPRDLIDARENGFLSRSEYASARRNEFARMLVAAGIPTARRIQLGAVDQEMSKNLGPLSILLSRFLADIKPEFVLTHAYEGGHPDHDATAFIVHAAVRLMEELEPITIVEMTGYHNGPNGIETGKFLGNASNAVSRTLTAPERKLKKKLLDCYVTQQKTLSLFSIADECFRVAPQYDFTTPPHEGTLYYEQFPWGMTADRFRKLAEDALDDLGLDAVNESGRIYLG
jgi:LmbE family N-acetylglucosaminyl deacetylase